MKETHRGRGIIECPKLEEIHRGHGIIECPKFFTMRTVRCWNRLPSQAVDMNWIGPWAARSGTRLEVGGPAWQGG